MRILWINRQASWAGGCEYYIAEMVQQLSQEGVQSALLYDSRFPPSPSYQQIFHSSTSEKEKETLLQSFQPHIFFLHQWRPLSSLQLPKDRPQVRFFHDHELFCLRHHKYTVMTRQTCTRSTGLRCYPCLGFLKRTQGRLGFGVTRLKTLHEEQADNRQLNAYIVASHYMKQHLKAHHFEEEKIQVFPLFAPLPQTLASPELPKERDLLFVGRLERGKGIDHLLSALKLTHAPHTLTLVGQGPQQAELEAQVQKNKLQACVSFKGNQNKSELALLYQTHRCLVLPSRSPETFGLVGPEAMSYGLPAVATDVGGIREWLSHGKTGLLVPSGDKYALAQALEDILLSPQKAHNFGQKALENYHLAFRPVLHKQRLFHFFSTLLQKG